MTDWQALERSAELAALTRARRRFLLPALLATAAFYGGFVVLCAFARDALDATLLDPFTLAHAWAVALFPFALVVALLYLRWCTRHVDPLAAAFVAARTTEPEREAEAVGR